MNTYNLLDSGKGRKLEQFGPYVISRPCSQAVWDPQLSESEWQKADAIFSRENENKWIFNRQLPDFWEIKVAEVTFKIAPTDFGHLGIFPEQKPFWKWLEADQKLKNCKVLNLFAYSGGATLAAAKGGAQVCHLDASKGMVAWARENAALSGLHEAPIRWIIDDVNKFLARELRRESRYEGIILDPPSFGRGSKGEIFKIEEEIVPLLENCRKLLSDHPKFIFFSCHTPGFTPVTMQHLLSQTMKGEKGAIESGEMLLESTHGKIFSVPSGTYAKWSAV